MIFKLLHGEDSDSDLSSGSNSKIKPKSFKQSK